MRVRRAAKNGAWKCSGYNEMAVRAAVVWAVSGWERPHPNGLSAALVAPTQALPEAEARTGTRPKPVPQRVETRYQSWPERGHKKDLVQSLGSGGSTLRSSVRKGSALRSDRYAARKRRAALTDASAAGGALL